MRGKVVREAGRVFGGLGLDACESALGLGLDGAERLPVKVQEVVGKAETCLHGKLTNGDAGAGGEVEFIPTLHEPACRRQVGVN